MDLVLNNLQWLLCHKTKPNQTYVCMCICMCVRIHVCTCMCMRACMCLNMCKIVCVCICVCLCMFMCVYVCMCVCLNSNTIKYLPDCHLFYESNKSILAAKAEIYKSLILLRENSKSTKDLSLFFGGVRVELRRNRRKKAEEKFYPGKEKLDAFGIFRFYIRFFDRFSRHVKPSWVILYLEVREPCSLLLFLKFLHTVVWYQVFLSNTNNLPYFT